ncbi:N-acetylglucosamine-6-phosphate deacetylase [Aureimonas sp. SA4125]|uniref:N-acetylglucosamine-6-phosphate deacetylase n=1 Tax=Aureimonas sp. SA4125 TaxID=2826993 RepID=UPI001E6E7BDF|nr:N-acetylglucosamine-6-phosphate deacetylase [Aureimonas sp. SA4125]
MERFALVGADIFDGEIRRSAHALVIAGERIAVLVPEGKLPAGIDRVELGGGLLAPGFIDIQVNGGGGVLFNDAPTVDGIAAICAAHARFGSTALLPTVITDRPDVTFAAIAAATRAVDAGVRGCLGVHVEGPFLSQARKGAHDPSLIRSMTEEDLQALLATTVRPLLLTVAPESVTAARIGRLTAAGIHVSLGHTEADFDTANAAFAAGAGGVTHLFNAMSQFGHRTPGLVGATLANGDVWCGIIADGHHVHPAAIALALRAKTGPGRLMAITDAMPTVGVDDDVFHLGGRRVERRDGRLTLEDGTLAGSDLSMIGAVRYLADTVGVDLDEALRMASLYPAQYLGVDADRGRLADGFRADIVHLDDARDVAGVWIGGVFVG